MVKVLVRAIGLFGKYEGGYDAQPITYHEVERSHSNIEKFLERGGTPIVDQQVNPLPYLEDGIITGPHTGSVYIFNNCLVANCFESGNGFNFDGVYQCLISAALKEEDIRRTFETLKREGDIRCFSYWRDNPKFIKEIEVLHVIDQDLSSLLKQEPKLLTPKK